MAYEYSDLVRQAKQWAQDLLDNDWLNEAQLNDVLHYDQRTPDSLFTDHSSRPLIVAFLGGTGVGKSTLLNRLAGTEIARTGVLRPTSKEVTLFHHHSVQIANLPSLLPLEKIKLAAHDEAHNRDIIWIDMPDFDSTEQGNQQLVLEWLPHIDVLVYVVSPERYRDNKAWQILRVEGVKHAWVFVMNQADRGQIEQYNDFMKQLAKAGFHDPLVYQSCCLDETGQEHPDDFAKLQATLQGLANDNNIQQLELRSQQVRKIELSKTLEPLVSLLGSETAMQELALFWQQQWQALERLLVEATQLPLQQMAEHYALNSAELASKSTVGNQQMHLQQRIWDRWAQSRFEDAQDALIMQASLLQIPVVPLKKQLSSIRTQAEKVVDEKTLLAVRKALIKPGNLLQRSVIKLAQFLEIVLPVMAMSWVGYQVFIQFYESSLSATPHYVGTDFAINSLMLIVIAWLFPYFIQKKLKPSIEKAALRGLKAGYITALQTLEQNVITELKQLEDQQQELRHRAKVMLGLCVKESTQLQLLEHSDLKRMLLGAAEHK